MTIRKIAGHILSVTAVFWFFAGYVWADCNPNDVFLRGDWGKTRFSVEIADTIPLRSKGLMHRPSLEENAGMLFVYNRPQSVSFWMENTLIPLDMLFIDSAGMVVEIHHNAIPLDRSPIFGGDQIVAVLEINGGLAQRLGVAIGSHVQHPVFRANTPHWPCS